MADLVKVDLAREFEREIDKSRKQVFPAPRRYRVAADIAAKMVDGGYGALVGDDEAETTTDEGGDGDDVAAADLVFDGEAAKAGKIVATVAGRPVSAPVKKGDGAIAAATAIAAAVNAVEGIGVTAGIAEGFDHVVVISLHEGVEIEGDIAADVGAPAGLSVEIVFPTAPETA